MLKSDIREQIIETASQVFKKYGFKKTTMDEIAAAMYKGKSSIYYYFKSKDEIFEVVVENEIMALKKKLTEAIEVSSDPKEQLKLYIVTRMNALKDLINLYEAIKNDFLAHLEFINKMRERYNANEIATIKGILEHGNSIKVFHVENTELTATSILTAMRGLEMPFLWEKNKDLEEQRTSCLIDILFHGIVTR
jgi:AcrR family transcriptional regulator